MFAGSVAAQSVTTPAVGQTIAAPTFSPIGNFISKAPDCNPYDIATARALTFKQRACFNGQKLVAPSMLFRGAFSGAYGQWRNNDPHLWNQNMDDFGRRLGSFYARHTAQDGAALLAGYLHHEDPRPHASGQHGFWNRTRAAFTSVMVTTDADGNSAVALAPIAGSFGAGFVGMAVSERHDHLRDGLRRTGISYGGYLGTALLHEFQPDLSNLAQRVLHKKQSN